MELTVVIGLVCSVLGALIGYAGYQHKMRQSSEDEGKEDGILLTEMGYIKSGIDDIKTEQREQRKTNMEVITRLTAVEAAAKQAHKRLDRMEGRDER